MANILSRITFGETELLEVDNNPAVSPGTSAKLGSLAQWDAGTTAKLYIKYGTHDMHWSEISSFKPNGFIGGLTPTYINANTVEVRQGFCTDTENIVLIPVTTPIQVSFSNPNGVNGLDTGVKNANNWYYLWVIYNETTLTTAGLFSLSNTNPTMPSGFNRKRLLPFAFKTESNGNILPFYVSSGWPKLPKIMYEVALAGSSADKTSVFNGNLGTSFTNINTGAFIPPISTIGVLYVLLTNAGRNLYIRNSNITHDGVVLTNPSAPTTHINVEVATNSSQQIQIKGSAGNTGTNISVMGFVVNGV